MAKHVFGISKTKREYRNMYMSNEPDKKRGEHGHYIIHKIKHQPPTPLNNF